MFSACPPLPYGPANTSVSRRSGSLALWPLIRSRFGWVGKSLVAARSYKCATGCSCRPNHSKWSHLRACWRKESQRGIATWVPFVSIDCPSLLLIPHPISSVIVTVIFKVIVVTVVFFPKVTGRRTYSWRSLLVTRNLRLQSLQNSLYDDDHGHHHLPATLSPKRLQHYRFNCTADA